MTYVHIRTDKMLSREVETALRDDLSDEMAILRKSRSACMIDIESGCNLAMGDGTHPCVMADIRFAVMPENELLRRFSVETAGLFTEGLGVDVDHIYFTFSHMPCCVTGPVLEPADR